ncbi:MAG: NapC/NirT family cytochrome c [Bacteroidota bacterium]
MKLPSSTYNWITIVGFFLALTNLFFILLLFIITAIFNTGSSYLGLFIYILLPGFMVLGLLLIPIGMLFKMKRLKKGDPELRNKLPYIDLNDRTHRNAFKIFIFSTLIFLLLTSIGSYEAFHYTESVQFCGELCHKVMMPEHVAYQNSPHARVACVECHVGPGTDWYVRSKLSGLYQVYSVLRHLYPTPIETPLRNLRPARETCEKCHWPQKFYARSLRIQKSYLTDSANSEWNIMMQIKVGPEYSAKGLSEGIHWHINPDTKVEYMSENDKRENIFWVKYTNLKTGKVELFKDEENVAADSIVKKASTRTMDCIDCHNRPSHNYKSPPNYINNAMLAGTISKDIPMIKFCAMDILKNPFNTYDSAMMMIDKGVNDYYKTNFPDYYAKNKPLITSAITGIKNAYNQNAFPSMKVTYDKYPNHIGHLESAGCFRCHNNRFKSESGKIISKDCNLCHTIVGQGKTGALQLASVRDSLEFQHPIPLKNNAWKTGLCSECHTYLYQ